MKYDQLILACIDCIQTYNPNREGPDSHSETYLQTKTKDSHERMFIKQVLYGILRYSEFLKIFTENLFHYNKASTERKDEILFQIFTYITVFRLSELPLEDYKQLVYSQDAVKMNEFFKFLFNTDNLNNVLRPEWIKCYDMAYVDNQLIAGLLKNAELLNDMLTLILNKAQGGANLDSIYKESLSNSSSLIQAEANMNKKVTIPEPFNLTKPKPKIIQPPIQIPNKLITRPVPYEDYQKETLLKIEEKRKNRLEVIKENVIKKYDSVKQIEFETAKRPTNIDKIRKQVEEKLLKELDYTPCKPVMDFSNQVANVKYNETAILREEYLIQKKKRQEEERLDKILIEKKDTKEFERWRKEMEEKENILKMEEIQKRKLELEMNREVAVDYFNQRLLQNKLMVAKHKEEEEQKLKEKQIQLQKELEEKRKLVKEMDKERENIIEEKEKLVLKNKELHQQQIADMKDIVLKAREEKRIEEDRRKDIIRQIRELEKLPIKRTKGFDPTETPGYGLLEEMSLAELRERLEEQNKFLEEFLHAKREENKIKNEERSDNLVCKAKLISEHRDKLRSQKEIERKQKQESKEQMANLKKEIREKSLFEVKNKIENKKLNLKKEEIIFENKIREIKLQRQYLQQGRAVVEEKAFKQIEDGLERKINDRQNKDLIEQERKESVKWGEIKIRYNSAKNEVKEKQSILDNYENTFNQLKQVNNICLNEEKEYKKSLYNKGREVAEVQKTKLREKHKFSNELKLTNKGMKEPSDSVRKTRTSSINRFNMSGSLSPNQSGSDDIRNKLDKEMA